MPSTVKKGVYFFYLRLVVVVVVASLPLSSLPTTTLVEAAAIEERKEVNIKRKSRIQWSIFWPKVCVVQLNNS